jgi:hypothetical protein
MRRAPIVVLLALAATAVWAGVFAHHQDSASEVAIYDPNPAHLWNRLHATFFVREDVPSTRLVPDALDPPLWLNTQYLLTEPSHRRAIRILDEFLKTHAENLIRDPLKRALLQRDLWAVFDWSVGREPDHVRDPDFDTEKRELQSRLAEVMRRLALSPEAIQALPNNYNQAVASGEFPTKYDPAHRERAFLPPDLFDPHGPWVELQGPDDPEPVAEEHFRFFSGRSSFLIFMRLPNGRKAAFDYLQTLWNFPNATVPSPNYAPGSDVAPSPDLPQLPVGTQFALVRQMTLFDSQGKLVSTPITESVQIRVYRDVAGPTEPPPSGRFDSYEYAHAQSGQDFYEIALSRPLLFSNHAGGLRAVGPNEREFMIFNSAGPDEGTPAQYVSLDKYRPVVEECVECHFHNGAKGINSVLSRARLLKPHRLQRDQASDAGIPFWWQDPRTISWKQTQDNWTLLNQYWKAAR